MAASTASSSGERWQRGGKALETRWQRGGERGGEFPAQKWHFSLRAHKSRANPARRLRMKINFSKTRILLP